MEAKDGSRDFDYKLEQSCSKDGPESPHRAEAKGANDSLLSDAKDSANFPTLNLLKVDVSPNNCPVEVRSFYLKCSIFSH
jgi:hypothetical protein